MTCESTHVDIEFILGLESKSFEKVEAQKKRILIVLADLFEEAPKSKTILALVTAGRHRNILFGGFKTQSFSSQKKFKNNRPECHAD